MEIKHFIYAKILLTLLLQMQIIHGGLDKASELKNGTQNNTNNINIENYQVKTTKGADLSQLQLQEAREAAAKTNKTLIGEGKTIAITGRNMIEKSRRRQMPTTNSNINQSISETKASLSQETDNKFLASVGDTVSASLEDTKKPKEHVVAVAENVVLNITDVVPKTNITQVLGTQSEPINLTKSSSTVNITTPQLQDKVIEPTPIVTANKTNLGGKMGNRTIESTPATPITKLISTPTSTSTTTTTTPSSKIITTTPKPKPKKPLVTYSVEDFPDLDEHVLQPSSVSTNSPSKLPIYDLEFPHAQPSQEHDAAVPFRVNRDYVVPIVAVMFLTPLLMGIVITAYRRFRDFWSTRHYRRMDFLVDGMYND